MALVFIMGWLMLYNLKIATIVYMRLNLVLDARPDDDFFV